MIIQIFVELSELLRSLANYDLAPEVFVHVQTMSPNQLEPRRIEKKYLRKFLGYRF